MPIDNVDFIFVKNNCHVAYCRVCGRSATTLSSTGTYQDAYPVTEDGTYDKKSNTFICWECYRKSFKKP